MLSRDIRDLLDKYNVEVVRVRRGKHICVTLKNACGATRMYTLDVSPSDWRGQRNTEARIRRFAHVD